MSLALAKGGVWYHGKAPTNAHAVITINLEGDNRTAYDALEDWIVSVFYHELFHNLQRNLNQANGGNGDVHGGEVWEFITEGTASLASSAGQSELEFAAGAVERAYFSKANIFLAGDAFYGDGLNTSYLEMNPYQTAL